VKDGLTGGWTLVYSPASSVNEFQITGTRMAVRNGSNLYVKDALGDPWTLETTSASAGSWSIAGNRIANLDASGLEVKDGLTGGWVTVSGTDTAQWLIT
jgi:hypothetical protein